MHTLDTNNHSVFLLNYHLVFLIKYRRKVIDDSISSRLSGIFLYIGKIHGIELTEWNHDKDHVRILFKSLPNTNLSKFINAYKAASSRLIKKEFPAMRSQLWQSTFWSKGYCMLTVGKAPLEVFKKYIESQKEHD